MSENIPIVNSEDPFLDIRKEVDGIIEEQNPVELKANGKPRIKSTPGAPKMRERGKIVGHNLRVGMKLRNRQMQYILDEMTEPELRIIQSNEPLAASLGMESFPDGLNKTAITYRILNTQGFGNGAHSSNNEPSYMSVAVFMRDIQQYLPKDLQPKRDGYQLWKDKSFVSTNTFGPETTVLLDKMVDWLIRMKRMIEDKITSIYFVNGRSHHLEILKRRYKDEWSEKVEQSVDANVVQDSTVNVLKIDFGENEEDSSTD